LSATRRVTRTSAICPAAAWPAGTAHVTRPVALTLGVTPGDVVTVYVKASPSASLAWTW
jgi:protein involved in polysaccharide export with SLBB domain